MQLALESEIPPLSEDRYGVIRIGGTRVTLESIISLFEQGATAEEITLRFDALDLHEVYASLSYYLGHRRDVLNYLERQHHGSVSARREADQRSPATQVRERLAWYRKERDAQSPG
jgi:uncharacterized protein (DUF433 family)